MGNDAQQLLPFAHYGCAQYSNFCALIRNIYCAKSLHSEYKFCVIALLRIGTVKYPSKVLSFLVNPDILH